MKQTILSAENNYAALDRWLQEKGIRSLFLVCGNSIRYLKLGPYFEALPRRLGIQVVRFSDFQPNPLYESVVRGTELFRQSGCGAIAAVGGGSAMDVAKCIKLYSNMNPDENYLHQPIVPNAVPFLAVPTTAGTGSEATRFAVIYYEGSKQSVADYSCIPEAVVLDPSVLHSLPLFQKKATMLDALCHAVESFWSVNSTPESRELSREAIVGVMAHMEGYLSNTEAGNAGMLLAANVAGQAINITQTTAGHAMCYKLTSLYGLPHGQAAALCVGKLFPYMASHTDKCCDPRGEAFLCQVLEQIAAALGCDSAESGAEKFEMLLKTLEITPPQPEETDFAILRSSVNPVRLKNHPVALDTQTIDTLYHEILRT